jgi:hypothetical protein
MPEPHTLLVFSNPVTGQEAEYLDWYENRHLAEVSSIDGVAFGRFFAIAALDGAAPMPWRYVARYAVVDEPADVVARVYEANASGRMAVPEWITDVGAWFFTATSQAAEPWERSADESLLTLDVDATPPGDDAAGIRTWTYSGVPFDPGFPSPWQALSTTYASAAPAADGGLTARLRPLTDAVHGS